VENIAIRGCNVDGGYEIVNRYQTPAFVVPARMIDEYYRTGGGSSLTWEVATLCRHLVCMMLCCGCLVSDRHLVIIVELHQF
jgi:hypothetical protein